MDRTEIVNEQLMNINNIKIKVPPNIPNEINNIIAKILAPGFDTYIFLNKWKEYYNKFIPKEQTVQSGGMRGSRVVSMLRSPYTVPGPRTVPGPVPRIINLLNMTLNDFITLQIHALFTIDTSIDKKTIRTKLDEVLVSKYGTSKYNDRLLNTSLKVLFRHMDNDKLENLITIISGLHFENCILGSQKPNNYEWIQNKQSALFVQIFILLKTDITNEFEELEKLLTHQSGGVRERIILYGGTNMGDVEFDKTDPNFLNTLYKILIEIQNRIPKTDIKSDNIKYKNYIDNIIYCFKTIQLYNSKKQQITITFSIQSIIIRFIILSIAYINAHMNIEYRELINIVITLYILNLIDESSDFFCNYICMSIADIPKLLPLDAKQNIYLHISPFSPRSLSRVGNIELKPHQVEFPTAAPVLEVSRRLSQQGISNAASSSYTKPIRSVTFNAPSQSLEDSQLNRMIDNVDDIVQELDKISRNLNEIAGILLSSQSNYGTDIDEVFKKAETIIRLADDTKTNINAATETIDRATTFMKRLITEANHAKVKVVNIAIQKCLETIRLTKSVFDGFIQYFSNLFNDAAVIADTNDDNAKATEYRRVADQIVSKSSSNQDGPDAANTGSHDSPLTDLAKRIPDRNSGLSNTRKNPVITSFNPPLTVVDPINSTEEEIDNIINTASINITDATKYAKQALERAKTIYEEMESRDITEVSKKALELGTAASEVERTAEIVKQHCIKFREVSEHIKELQATSSYRPTFMEYIKNIEQIVNQKCKDIIKQCNVTVLGLRMRVAGIFIKAGETAQQEAQKYAQENNEEDRLIAQTRSETFLTGATAMYRGYSGSQHTTLSGDNSALEKVTALFASPAVVHQQVKTDAEDAGAAAGDNIEEDPTFDPHELRARLEQCTKDIEEAAHKVTNIAEHIYSTCHVYGDLVNFVAYKIEAIENATDNVKKAADAITDLTEHIDNIREKGLYSEQMKDILSDVYDQSLVASIEANKVVTELINAICEAFNHSANYFKTNPELLDRENIVAAYTAAAQVFDCTSRDLTHTDHIKEHITTIYVRTLFTNRGLYGIRTEEEKEALYNIPRIVVSDNATQIDELYEKAVSIVQDLQVAGEIARNTGNEVYGIYENIRSGLDQEVSQKYISQHTELISKTIAIGDDTVNVVNENIQEALLVAREISDIYKTLPLSDDTEALNRIDKEALNSIYKYVCNAIKRALIDSEYANYGTNEIRTPINITKLFVNQEFWEQEALQNAESSDTFKEIEYLNPPVAQEVSTNRAHRAIPQESINSTGSIKFSELDELPLPDGCDIATLTTNVTAVVDKLEKAKTNVIEAGNSFSDRLCDLYNKPIDEVSTQTIIINNAVSVAKLAIDEAIKPTKDVEKYITEIANIIKDTDLTTKLHLEDLKTSAIKAKVDYLIYANAANIAVRNLLLYVSSLYKQTADDADEKVAIVNEGEDNHDTLIVKAKNLRIKAAFFKKLLQDFPVRIPDTEFTGGTADLLSLDGINVSALPEIVDTVVAELETAANTSYEVANNVNEIKTDIEKKQISDLSNYRYVIWEVTVEAKSAYDNATEATKKVNRVLEIIKQKVTENKDIGILENLQILNKKANDAITQYESFVDLAKNAAVNLRMHVGKVFNDAATESDTVANNAARVLTIAARRSIRAGDVKIDTFKAATYNAAIYRAIVLVLGSLPKQEGPDNDATAPADLINKTTHLTDQIKEYKINTIIAKKKADDFLKNSTLTENFILEEAVQIANNVEASVHKIQNHITILRTLEGKIHNTLKYDVVHHYELNLSIKTVMNYYGSARKISAEALIVAKKLTDKIKEFEESHPDKKEFDQQSESPQDEAGASSEKLNMDQIKEAAKEVVKRIDQIITDASGLDNIDDISDYIWKNQKTIILAFKDVNNLIDQVEELIEKNKELPSLYVNRQTQGETIKELIFLRDAKQALIKFIIGTRTVINDAVNPAIIGYANTNRFDSPQKQLRMKVRNLHNLTFEELEEVIKDIYQGAYYIVNSDKGYKKVVEDAAPDPTDLLFVTTDYDEIIAEYAITQQYVDGATAAAKELNTERIEEQSKSAVKKVNTILEEMKIPNPITYDFIVNYVEKKYDEINTAINDAYCVITDAEEVIKKINEFPTMNPNPFQEHFDVAANVVKMTNEAISKFLNYINDIRQNVRTNIDTFMNQYSDNPKYKTSLANKPSMDSLDEDYEKVLNDIINGIKYYNENIAPILDSIHVSTATPNTKVDTQKDDGEHQVIPDDSDSDEVVVEHNPDALIENGKTVIERINQIIENMNNLDRNFEIYGNYVDVNNEMIISAINDAQTTGNIIDQVIKNIQEGDIPQPINETLLVKTREEIIHTVSELIKILVYIKTEIITEIEKFKYNYTEYKDREIFKVELKMETPDKEANNYHNEIIAQIKMGINYIKSVKLFIQTIEFAVKDGTPGVLQKGDQDEPPLASENDSSKKDDAPDDPAADEGVALAAPAAEPVYDSDFEDEDQGADEGDTIATLAGTPDQAKPESDDEESDEENSSSSSENSQVSDDQRDTDQEVPIGKKPQDVSVSQLLTTVKPVTVSEDRKSGSIIDKERYIEGIEKIYNKLWASNSKGKKVIEQIKTHFEDTDTYIEYTGYDVTTDLCIGFYVCYIFFDTDIKDCYEYILPSKEYVPSLYKAYIIYKFLYKSIFNIPLINILFYYIQNICNNKTIISIDQLKNLLTDMHNTFKDTDDKPVSHDDITNIKYNIDVILHLYARLSHDEFTFNQSRIYANLTEAENIDPKPFISWDQTNCIYNFAYYYSILSIYSVKEILELYNLRSPPIKFDELLQLIVPKIDPNIEYIKQNIKVP